VLAKAQYRDRAQLVLELERQVWRRPVGKDAKGLIEALVDRVLEALQSDRPRRRRRREAWMSTKITPDHLRRAAVVYVRQSTMAQVAAISKVSAGA
jgi:hypothetical protein